MVMNDDELCICQRIDQTQAELGIIRHFSAVV